MFDAPATGRYIKIVAKSTIDGRPIVSAAEFDILQ
jgi:hypothetical protein